MGNFTFNLWRNRCLFLLEKIQNMKFKIPFKIKNFWLKNEEKISLEKCVSGGILTKEEMLRIKKDRAIEEWENETGQKVSKRVWRNRG